jgi:outer membrane protein assembly factor BamB
VVDGNGTLTSFKPTTGEKIDSYELASGIVTAPIIANGALYVMTKAGTLYKYY